MYGLSHVGDVLRLISDVEKKIYTLRFIAKTLHARPDSLLIRYRQIKKSSVKSSEPAGFDDEMFLYTQDHAMSSEQESPKSDDTQDHAMLSEQSRNPTMKPVLSRAAKLTNLNGVMQQL